MCVIYTGSTPGAVNDVFYRANEGTKIHLTHFEISLKRKREGDADIEYSK